MDILQFTLQLTVSIIALIVSGVSFYLTNRMNKKVNKKDYEISENLKYELMKLIAALRSMDAKAVLTVHFKQKMDYSREIDILADLQTSPGYLLFLNSIENDDERMLLDTYMKILVIDGNTMSKDDIRILTNKILDSIRYKANLKATLDIDVIALLNDLCTMRGTAPELSEKDKKPSAKSQMFSMFIQHLVEQGNTDPNVLLFYAVFTENKDLVDEAIASGANPNTRDIELIKKYQKEYDDFCASQGQGKAQ